MITALGLLVGYVNIYTLSFRTVRLTHCIEIKTYLYTGRRFNSSLCTSILLVT